MSVIQFETKLITINGWTILHLPEEASAKLPSRGMTMVAGTINGVPFKTVLESDGRYMSDAKPSHWFKPDDNLLKQAKATTGDKVQITLEPTKEWIEPELPDDVNKAIASSPKAQQIIS